MERKRKKEEKKYESGNEKSKSQRGVLIGNE